MPVNYESATARDIMHEGCTCIGEHDTLADAARVMASEGIGALPICGDSKRLIGMITDRDIVVKGLAEGKDPGSTEAGEFADGEGGKRPKRRPKVRPEGPWYDASFQFFVIVC